ncbi:Shikimate kinase [Sulfurovum sp. enrichment culture clone C5]|uniref:Shikimate kinase n=1 Tax=Sulfurovum sp. enrichment culture clone C5 TaxID=497650 RepID=A0A0S4XM74_9BACT|nr:Shikimate kinase [Sulfurovum sp. enrichment culture clone C5]
MEKNIILIGFMGVGKGTIARAFAKEYKVYNIDTDDLIESKTNKEVKKIFERYGEERFRALEQETANWIEANVKGTLVSCGGGFYKVNNLKSLGTVVLLDASFEWIHKRLKNAKNSKAKLAKRPLFAKEKEAKKLYNERAEIYRQVADVIVDVEKLATKEILEIISQAANISK